MSSYYDSFGGTSIECDDPDANEREMDERELAEDMAENPEFYENGVKEDDARFAI